MKNSRKTGSPFDKLARQFEKLARQVEKLARLWHVGTKNEMLARFWLVDILARRHVDHAGTHGTQFSKLETVENLASLLARWHASL